MAISLSTALGIAAGVGVVSSLASGAVGIASSVQQHEQAKANAEAQEAQARYNQMIEQNEARRVEAENAENMRRQREAAEQLKAQQRALLGASGAAMTSGSPLAILGQTAMDQERQVQDTAYAGYRQAQSHSEQAKMYDYQARVARASRPSALSLGLNVAGQGLSTFGSVAQTIGNYAIGRAQLKSTGMGNKSIWG